MKVDDWNFGRWLFVNRRVIQFLLFTDEATSTREDINNTRNSHQWSEENPHAIVEIHFQESFSVVCYDRQSVVLPHRFTGSRYLYFLQNELPALLEEIPLAKSMGIFFQYDGAPAHCSRHVIHHLNPSSFPGRWLCKYGHCLRSLLHAVRDHTVRPADSHTALSDELDPVAASTESAPDHHRKIREHQAKTRSISLHDGFSSRGYPKFVGEKWTTDFAWILNFNYYRKEDDSANPTDKPFPLSQTTRKRKDRADRVRGDL
ncbi:hypothetical protein ANN_00075 [Periplaneta americana]|uniref:Transposase n=1 Tax=Periplaneta americana TaxID=6978 RepID=A0ABQ8TSI9_PERAM|nr:hypothetical protein ANN_00075 [Periplaneta americana]